MPKVTSSQNNMTNGEISPIALGRFDITKYPNSVKTLENFLINQLGGAFFRPGTRYVASTKDNGIARLMPFQYSADQDYVVEVGDAYMRFYSNTGSLLDIPTSFDSYTKLLLHCDGTDGATTVVDEIGNTITSEGTAQLDTAQKKFGTASLLLDGDSDYLTVPDSEDWNFGTGDFTIDFWIRFSDKTGEQCFFEMRDADGTPQVYFRKEVDGNLAFRAIKDGGGDNAYYITASAPTINNGTWYHLMLVRSTTTIKIALDGTFLTLTETTAMSTNAVPASNRAWYIGSSSTPGNYINGWIDEFRVSKGIARETSDFTAPTTAYSKVTSTELSSPYVEDDVFDLHHAHKNDVKYITHLDYAPRKLSRTSATEFTIATVSFVRGPFLDTNTTTTTITPSADSGDDVTLTGSTDLFDDLHVGSLWRVKSGVVKITAVNSPTEAVGDVEAEPDGSAGALATGPAATTDWAEGAFSGYRGYPKTCVFHAGRLYYANTEYEPQKVWGSNLYGYDNFDVGSAGDDEAVSFEIATEERTAILWMSSSSKSLMLGSTGGTFSVAGTNSAVITPDDIQVARDTNYGVSGLEPKRISSFLYYVQRNLRKVRELSYWYDTDSQRSLDMTLLAEHIIKDGDVAIQMDHQQAPNDRLWIVRDDGQLVVLTRNPEQEVMGWARVVAGTDSTSEGKFESVVVIPKASDDDQVWGVVNRTIDGTTKRFLEFFSVEDFDDDWDAIRVDCSLTLDSPVTISGATSAEPVVITATSHGFSNGDQVKIDNVVGMTELNGQYFLVANKADNTFELTDLDGVDIDGTEYTDYVSGGEVREMVTAISGLGHLEGETVTVQVDGSIPSTETYLVSSGAITLSQKAAVVHVGLPYTGTIRLLKLSDGSPTGTGQTKNRRIFGITFRVDRSLGLSVGRDASNQDTLIPYAFDDDDMPPDLHTGDFPEDRPKHFKTGWGTSDEVVIIQNKPLPAHILAIILQSEVTD